MTRAEALRLIVNEAVDCRDYFTWENRRDDEAIGKLVEAVEQLGCSCHVSDDGEIKVVSWGEEFE